MTLRLRIFVLKRIDDWFEHDAVTSVIMVGVSIMWSLA